MELSDEVGKIVKAAVESGANVKVDGKPVLAPIPPHIAGNICHFLQRVDIKGVEAIPWVEAFNFMQKHTGQAAPGIPFQGLPK
jgi:hypothetical protein